MGVGTDLAKRGCIEIEGVSRKGRIKFYLPVVLFLLVLVTLISASDHHACDLETHEECNHHESRELVSINIPKLSQKNLVIDYEFSDYQLIKRNANPIRVGEPILWDAFISNSSDNFSIVYETPPIDVRLNSHENETDWTRVFLFYTDYSDVYKNVQFSYDLPTHGPVFVSNYLDYTLIDNHFSIILPEINKTRSLTITGKFWEGNVLNETNLSIETNLTNVTNQTIDYNVSQYVNSLGTFSITSENGIVDMFNVDEQLNVYFKISNLENGSNTTVTLELPIEIPEGIHFYLWKTINDETIQVPYEISESRTSLKLFLQDGVVDDDGLVNGIIEDPLQLFIPKYDINITKNTSSKILVEVAEKKYSIRTVEGQFDTVKIVDPSNVPNTPSNFEFKLLKFNITNITNHTDIYIDADVLPRNPKIWKFNPNKMEWYSFPVQRIDEDTLKITLYDGGLGDDDGIRNGIIEDDLGITSKWWNESWNWRYAYNVTNPGNVLTDYELMLNVTNSTFNFSKSNENMTDIRFTFYNSTSGNETLLSHYFYSNLSQDYTTGNFVATFFVNIPYIDNVSNSTIFMYYGNSTATSTSDGDATFLFFDNFSGSSYNTTKWGTNFGSGVAVSNNDLRMDDNWNTGGRYFATNNNFASPVVLDTRVTIIGSTTDRDLSIGFVTPQTDQWWTDTTATWLIFDGVGSGAAQEKTIKINGNSVTGGQQNTNDWHYVRVKYNSTYTGYYDTYTDSTLSHTGTQSDPFYLSLAGDSDSATRFVYFDYIILRKWAEVEPIVNNLGEERVGLLNTTIDEPQQNSEKYKVTPFTSNGTIECLRGDCGNVSVDFQYFSTASPTLTWSETTVLDFNNYSTKENISVSDGYFSLQSNNLGDPWWDIYWVYRSTINISNTYANLTEFPVKILLNSSRVNSNFDWTAGINDTRFAWYNSTSGLNEEVSYWIQNWSDSDDNATIWIKAPFLENNTDTEIYIYYGNPTANPISNGSAVFDFFDNFSGTAYDSNKWTTNGGSDKLEVLNGTVRMRNDWNNDNIYMTAEGSYTDTRVVEGRWRLDGFGSGEDRDLSVCFAPAITTGWWSTSSICTIYDGNAAAGTSNQKATKAYSTTSTSGSKISSTAWHDFKMEFGTTSLAFYDSYTDAWLNNTFVSLSPYYVQIAADTDGASDYGYVDYIFVRQYAQVEPSYSSTGSEQLLQLSSEGEYQSSVFDTGSSEIIFQNLSWGSDENENTSVTIFTRTSGGAGNIWWDSSWTYRQAINLTISTVNVTGYQAKIDINTTGLNLSGKINENCSDLRVIWFNTTTLEHQKVPYWIENCNATGQNTTLWVKAHEVRTDTPTVLQIYYGNSGAASEENGSAVFDFFDEFNNTAYDTNVWSQSSGSSVSVANGKMRVNTGAVYTNNIVGGSPQDKTMEAKARVHTHAESYAGLMVTDAQSAAGSNGNSNALAWIMTGGTGTIYQAWGANGTTASYNIVGGGTVYSSATVDKDFIIGLDFNNDSELVWFVDDLDYTNVGTLSRVGNWNENYYMWIGYFTGSAAGASNGDDISVDWVRVRSNKNEEVASIIETEKNYTEVTQDISNYAWSSWFLESNDTAIQSPDAQYIQYKAVLNSTNENQTSQLKDISIGYQITSTGWSNISSSGTLFTGSSPYECGVMTAGNKCNPSLSLVPHNLGNFSLRLVARTDFKEISNSISSIRNISVWSNPTLTGFTKTVNPVELLESTTLEVLMLDESSQPLANKNITFYDETHNGTRYYIGNTLTDASGYASIVYTIPNTSNYGTHTLNASFSGNPSQFLKYSEVTTTIKISSTPQIINITETPTEIGFGYDAVITANITDAVGLDKIRINVSEDLSTWNIYDMELQAGATYNYTLNKSWVIKNYSYYILANNTDGIETITSLGVVPVLTFVSINFSTDKLNYKNNEKVYVDILPDGGLYAGWSYMREINLTTIDNITDYPMKIDLTSSNFDFTLTNETGKDIRFAYKNKSSGNQYIIPYWIEEFNATAQTGTIWARVPNISVGVENNIYIYFGNNEVETTGNGSNVFDFFDSFDGTALDSKWNSTSPANVNVGGGRVRINAGTVFTNATTARSDNEIFESKLRWYASTGSQYAGMMTVDVSDMQGSNSGADANILYMTNAGGSNIVRYWAGDGTVTGYNLGNANVFTRTADTDYVLGIGFDGTNTRLFRDYSEQVSIGTFNETVFLYLGAFTGSNSGSSDIQDINVTWIRARQYAANEPAVSIGSTIIRSNGFNNIYSTKTSGYMRMLVQKWTGASWQNIVPPVVEMSFQEINAYNSLNISKIWSDAGAWNTTNRDPGDYRVKIAVEDPSVTTLIDGSGTEMIGYYNFTILEPILIVDNLDYENNFSYGLKEYETGDTIDWINITIKPLNNTAYSANATLSILDNGLDYVGWGPINETQLCGDLNEDELCEKSWDNSTNGYFIPTDASAGRYSFYWNVLMQSENGQDQLNNSETFIINNIPATITTALTDIRIYKPNSTLYNFSFNNTWSQNLTNATLNINCPPIAGISCVSLTTNETNVTLGDVESSEVIIATFNITMNASVPSADYLVNVTLNYTNPGGENRSWSEQGTRTVEARVLGILAITDYGKPANVTRNYNYGLQSYINNTGDLQADNAWLNYTLQNGWTISTGNQNQSYAAISPSGIAWNNITVSVGQTSDLGAVNIRLDSSSDQGQADFKIYSVDVYANTSVDLTTSTYVINREENLTILSQLKYDNGSVLSNENISFYDETTGGFVGSDLTNSTGWAEVVYFINSTSTLGIHTINASFPGKVSKYVWGSENTTTIDVHQIPVISSVAVTPNVTGYGQEIFVSADISDADDIDTALITFFRPNGPSVQYLMNFTPPTIFNISFTDTWELGNYSFVITANDTTGASKTSGFYNFTINATLSIGMKTVNDSYGQNKYVNLSPSASSSWWNALWGFSKDLNISGLQKNFIDYQINVTLDTGTMYSNSRIRSDCGDIRFVYYNATSASNQELDHYIEGICNTSSGATTEYWVKVPELSVDNSSIQMYYGNSAATATNTSADNIFDFYDGFDGSSLDTGVWTSTSGANNYVGGGRIRINNGAIYTDATVGQSEYMIFESKHRWYTGTGTGYSGLMTVDVQDMQGSNSGADANILYMTAGGGTNVQYYGGDGTVTGYNMGSGTAFTMTQNQDYVLGVGFNGTNTILSQNGVEEHVFSGTYNESVYMYLGYFTGSNAGGVDIQDLNATWVRTRKYQYPAPTVSVSSENSVGSKIFDTGGTVSSGYMILKVQRNSSGSWQDVAIVMNDTQTSTLRTTNSSGLDISSLWNNYSWFTSTQPNGYYRAYAEFVDSQGDILTSSDSANVSGYWIFQITPPDVQINISDIRIYELTDASQANWHFYTNDLIDSGLSKTFTLSKDNIYRMEIDVYNYGSSKWEIDTTNLSYAGFNSSWGVVAADDIWYSVETLVANRRTDTSKEGGIFNGSINWNITQYKGNLTASNTATFFAILNITSSENVEVIFEIDQENFNINDTSNLDIIVTDSFEPVIINNMYNLTDQEIYRGNSTIVYAQWNETITEANGTYSTTNPIVFATITNSSAENIHNWTNFTIQSYSTWYLGDHDVNIVAMDQSGNVNDTLPNLNLSVWGLARITSSSLNASTINVSDDVLINCRVTDTTDFDSAISGYNVTFSNSSIVLGYNATNSTGWASFVYNDGSAGTEQINCSIVEDTINYYKIESQNSSSLTLTTLETEPPYYTSIVGPSIVHKGENVSLNVYWLDNFDPEQTILSVNTSGTYANISTQTLVGNESWSNFSYQIPNSFNPGSLGWIQYANDSSGNYNETPAQAIEVWGYSQISNSYLTPSSIQEGGNSSAGCRIIDANSSTVISGYNVSFWYKLAAAPTYTLLGTNLTNSSGYANWNITIATQGSYNIKCNISSEASLKYNNSNNNQSINVLNVVSGADVNPPVILGNNYTVNDTEIYRSQCFHVSGLWNETIDRAWVLYNTSSLDIIEVNVSKPYTNDWTNVSICTNSTWSLGNYSVKLYANDTTGNVNSTLGFNYVMVKGRSKVYWDLPTGNLNRTSQNITCEVQDFDSSLPIQNYNVTFYDGDLGGSIGTALTNSSGIARIEYDYSSAAVGPDELSCGISSSSENYYDAVAPTLVSETVYFYGRLNATLLKPKNASLIHRGQRERLDASVKDENGDVPLNHLGATAPLSGKWHNSSNYVVASDENSTWKVPDANGLGPTTLKFNVTETYYYPDTEYADVVVYGYSEIALNTPAAKAYPASTVINITCRVTDNETNLAINTHAVKFFDNTTDLGWASANSTGYAVKQINTDTLSNGVHEFKCELNHNASLYYNISSIREDLVNITVDKTVPTISFNSNTDTNGSYNKNWIFVNITASDQNKDDILLYWNGVPESFSSSSADLYWSNKTALSDGIYSFYGFINDSAGNSAQTTIRRIVLDTTNPIVTIVSPQNQTYSVTNIDLNVTIDENASSCWYNFDLGANISMTEVTPTYFSASPAISEGTHTVYYYCNDTVNLTGTNSTEFTVDRTAPISNLISPNDNLFTNQTTNQFVCEAQDNVNLVNATLYGNFSNSWLANQTNTSGINFTNYTFDVTLGDGEYIWNCKICDDANCAYNSTNNTITIDNTIPSVTLIQPIDKWYDSTSVNLNYTFVDTNYAACWYSIDDGANNTLASCNNATMNSLSEGNHNVTVYVNDSAGNLGQDSTLFSVDVTLPSINISSPINTTNYSTQSDVDLNLTINDNQNISHCWYSLDSGANTSMPGCTNTTLIGLSNANHTLTVYLNDSAGNVNSSTIWFVVDFNVLVATPAYPLNNSFISSETIWLNATTNKKATDCNYSLDGAAFAVMSNYTTLDWYANSSLLSEAPHNVTYRCVDAVNSSITDTVYFTIDRTNPAVTISNPIEDQTYPSENVTLNYTYSDTNNVTCYYSVDAGAYSALASCSNVSMNLLSDGYHNVSLKVNDTASNNNITLVNFFVDTTAPILTVVSPLNQTYAVQTIDFNVSSNENLTSCWYNINQGTNYSMNSQNNTYYYNATTLSDGTHTAYYYCNDTVNNVGSVIQDFAVDTTGPIITFVTPTPSDGGGVGVNSTFVNITLDETLDTAIIEWRNASGSFNYTMSSLNVTNYYYNFTNLTDNTYQYKVFVNDSVGNTRESSLRTVIVSTVAPVINIHYPLNAVTYSTTLFDLNVSSNKNIIRWIFTLNGENFTFTPNETIVGKLNTNTLMVYGTDASGKTGNASITFDVNVTTWLDEFDDFTGMQASEQINADGNASLDFCYPIYQVNGPPQDNQNTCWHYRKELNVSSSSTLTNFQTLLSINLSSEVSNDKALANCSDLRFSYYNSTSGAEQQISHWTEECNSLSNASVWVNIPEISATTLVYVYYGNNKSTDASDGDAVFELFDEFDNITVANWGANAANWESQNNESYPTVAGATSKITSTYTYDSSYATDIRINGNSTSGSAGYYDFGNSAGNKYLRFYLDPPNTRVNLYNGANNYYTVDSSEYQKYTIVSDFTNDNYTLHINGSGTEVISLGSSSSGSRTSPVLYSYYDRGLFVDYIAVRKYNADYPSVASIGTEETPVVNGSLQSILSAPSPFGAWSTFRVIADYPSGTNITYRILNSSNSSICGELYYADVKDGYKVCTAADSYSSLYLYANLTTDTTLITPSILNWTISWFDDNVSPIINSYNATPNTTAIGNNLIIFANATDNVGVDIVLVDINGTVYNMINNTADIYQYTLNTSNFTVGIYNYTIYANDTVGNNATPVSGTLNLTASGYMELYVFDIRFDDESFVEGDVSTVTVDVNNSGTLTAEDFVVQLNISLYNGTTILNETLNSSLFNLSAGNELEVNFSWTNKIGTFVFDALVDSTNAVSETVETNNDNSTNRTVGSWEFIYGFFNYSVFLGDASNQHFMNWSMVQPIGNIFYSDVDASFFAFDLLPLNGTNDLGEADAALGIGGLNDSIRSLFDQNNDGDADLTMSIEIAGTVIENVPVVNSTNSTNFVTGLLWDSSDGAAYTGSEDLVIVTVVNASKTGFFDTYDYEVRLPSTLGVLKPGSNSVERLAEMK